MHDYSKYIKHVDESFKIELPKDLCEKLSIEVGDKVNFCVDENENIVLQKPLKLSKEFMTQKRIVELSAKYSGMQSLVFKNEIVVATSVEEIKLGDRVKSIEKKDRKIFKEKEPEFILENSDKYVVKKVFPLIHYETDLGYLAIIDQNRASKLEKRASKMLSELVRFSVGDTYEKLL